MKHARGLTVRSKLTEVQPGRMALSVLLKPLVFIGLCGVFGFGLIHYNLVANPFSHSSTSVATSDGGTDQAAQQRRDTTIQHNPLFATQPSWYQNFEHQPNGSLDPTYWNTLVGPAENNNNEQQYYTASPSNLRIENGALRLIATHEPQPGGYSYGSSRIETDGNKSFLYGRIDIVAKLPSGVGTWPAVWLLPANDIYARKSPTGTATSYRNGGEIDIMEAVGFLPDEVDGVAHTVADIQTRPDGTGLYGTATVPGSSKGFYRYTLLWTPTRLEFAVNNKTYVSYDRQKNADYTTWPFDQPFYLIANLALGGTWGGMDTAHFPGNGIDNHAFPTSLDIHSIYYYPYIGPTAIQ